MKKVLLLLSLSAIIFSCEPMKKTERKEERTTTTRETKDGDTTRETRRDSSNY